VGKSCPEAGSSFFMVKVLLLPNVNFHNRNEVSLFENQRGLFSIYVLENQLINTGMNLAVVEKYQNNS
jgi:hypothetical protein